MESIVLIDTSIGSFNLGDSIIMECVRKELDYLTKSRFVRTLPSHVSAFHWYQVWRNSLAVRCFANSKYKFVGGSNLLVKDMLTHFPQWNVNLFNYKPIKGCVLVGVGASAGDKTNWYTKHLYRKMLNNEYYHSLRDQRSVEYLESIGLKGINTGCVTMWALTPEFCKTIPTSKANEVVFTLTAGIGTNAQNRHLVETLKRNYDKVYFWPQGDKDDLLLKRLKCDDGIIKLPATLEAYDSLLTEKDVDYVGMRLHGGIYAMRHHRRAIIMVVDERARSINESNKLPCIELADINALEAKINSDFATEIKMDFEAINRWRSQFK